MSLVFSVRQVGSQWQVLAHLTGSIVTRPVGRLFYDRWQAENQRSLFEEVRATPRHERSRCGTCGSSYCAGSTYWENWVDRDEDDVVPLG